MLFQHSKSTVASFLFSMIAIRTISAFLFICSLPLWASDNSGGMPDDIVVTDFSDRVVTLSKPAQRIVALAPHIVENIFSAGAGHSIVGTVAYADYPEAAKSIPRVGNIQGFSIEAIVALEPDLVIVWRSGHSNNVTQQLMDLGLTVYVDEPRVLEDVAKAIRDVGVLTAHQKESDVVAGQFLEKLQGLRQQYTQQQPVSVLYQVWDKPLQTLNGQHIISDVIRLCGGRNSFADAVVIAPKISVESVLERNPDVIVASGMGEERPDWLDAWLQWTSLSAVQNQHLFFIPPDLIQRHTVRMLQGAQQLCEQLTRVRKDLLY